MTLFRTCLLLPLLAVSGLLGACATPAGVIFPPLAKAPAFPPPPDPTRITYLGKIETDSDLKPSVNGFDAFGQAVFGKKDSRSMLTPIAVCADGPVTETKEGGGTGRVFVADSNAQLVHVFNFATRQYAIWKPAKGEPALSQPVALAWDAPRQRLLVSDSFAAAVVIFDTTGRYLGEFGGGAKSPFKRPVGIAIDAAHNRILVADTQRHQILVLSPDGALLQALGERGTGPGQFNYPTNLAIDSDGFVYVSDSLNFRIQQFDAQLKFVRQIGKKGDLPGYFAQPKGIALDRENHLYVIDAQFENIQLYNRDGHVLMDFGEEGSGPAQFWLPGSLFIDPNNRIIVADSYNRRLQFFDYKTPPAETQP